MWETTKDLDNLAITWDLLKAEPAFSILTAFLNSDEKHRKLHIGMQRIEAKAALSSASSPASLVQGVDNAVHMVQ